MLFKCKVIEIRHVPMEYEVEAVDKDAAFEQAVKGETLSEDQLEMGEVADRVVGSVKEM